MNRKVIYIAGPFRGETAWDVEQNIRRAEEAALYVAKCGHVALCPHTMNRFFNGTLTDDYWIEATLELLQRCDAILLLDGWTNSEGARGEYAAARERNMPWFVDDVSLSLWLEKVE